MGFSVNTNVGAKAALQSLSATNRQLDITQGRINSGLNVSSAKDDSAAYNIAQGLRGDISGLSAVSSSLNNAKSVTDVAVAGAESISDILNQMKTLAAKATDAGLTDAQLDQYDTDFQALGAQIQTVIDSADFNGINLLKDGGGDVAALQSLKGGTASGTDWDPSFLSVSNVGFDQDADISDVMGGTIKTGAQTMLDSIKAAADAVGTALSDLGSASRTIDSQITFTSKLTDALDRGVGNLVDADLAKESANLQALQVKQQLGVQALSIANQAPQTILSLFR